MTSNIASAVRRSDQIFSEQVGDKTTLDCGVAYFDLQYPHSTQDNALREVWVEQADAMPAAWAEVEQLYADRGAECLFELQRVTERVFVGQQRRQNLHIQVGQKTEFVFEPLAAARARHDRKPARLKIVNPVDLSFQGASALLQTTGPRAHPGGLL